MNLEVKAKAYLLLCQCAYNNARTARCNNTDQDDQSHRTQRVKTDFFTIVLKGVKHVKKASLLIALSFCFTSTLLAMESPAHLTRQPAKLYQRIKAAEQKEIVMMRHLNKLMSHETHKEYKHAKVEMCDLLHYSSVLMPGIIVIPNPFADNPQNKSAEKSINSTHATLSKD